MFYTNYSSYEGEPVRLYRSVGEIRRDICEIKRRIASTDERLNVRLLLGEIASECTGKEAEQWVPILRDLVSEAEDTLEGLKSLKTGLDELFSELEDTKWAQGM
ncbi:MAG: hypothetical protein IJY24_06275 [Clostridia bacterium]|nr:hypothetical protein [Clostridia bacterium]